MSSIEARPPDAMIGIMVERASANGESIDAGKDAVTVDIGIDDGSDAGAFEAPGHFGGGEFRGLGHPSTATLPPRASDADGDAAGNLRAASLTSAGSRTATVRDDAEHAAAEPVLDLFERADAAAKLHREP